VLKGVPSGGTRVKVEELWQDEAILNFEVQSQFYRQNYDRGFSRQNYSEVTADLEV